MESKRKCSGIDKFGIIGVFQKHRVILWLALLNRLQTRERLIRFMHIPDTQCVLCNKGILETQGHLLFDCNWSAHCFQMVEGWLRWRCRAMELMQIVRWLQRCRISKFQKKVFEVSLAAVVYGVWHARNRQTWENERTSIETVFNI